MHLFGRKCLVYKQTKQFTCKYVKLYINKKLQTIVSKLNRAKLY